MRLRSLLLLALLLSALAAWVPAPADAGCTVPFVFTGSGPLPPAGVFASSTAADACQNVTLSSVDAKVVATHCDAAVDVALATACAALSVAATVPVGGTPSVTEVAIANACVSEAVTTPPQSVCTSTIVPSVALPPAGFITLADVGTGLQVVTGYDPADWSCGVVSAAPTPIASCVPLQGSPTCTELVVYAQSLGPSGAVHGRGSCAGAGLPEVQTGDAIGAGQFGVFYAPQGPATEIRCEARGVFGSPTPSPPYSVTCATA